MSNEKNHFYRLKVIFRLRQPRKARAAIYCRITLNGYRAPEFSTYRIIETAHWHQKKQLMMSGPEAEIINMRLAQIRLDIERKAIEMQLAGALLTATTLHQAYLTSTKPAEAPKPSKVSMGLLVELFTEAKRTQRRPRLSAATIESYGKYWAKIVQYMTHQRRKTLYADQCTVAWCEGYLDWLHTQHRGDYPNKCVAFVRQILLWADKNGHIPNHPARGLKLHKVDDIDTTHLEPDELERLINLDLAALPLHPLTVASLEAERDCFVLTCYTGQHHADLRNREVWELYQGIDRRTWLRDKRQKTGVAYNVPLHPVALAIIEKYGGIERLPVRANSKRNSLLKQLAAFALIPKLLSTKIGRKTFTDYCLNSLLMREETVAALLGHKSTKYVKHYGRISERSIAKEMRF